MEETMVLNPTSGNGDLPNRKPLNPRGLSLQTRSHVTLQFDEHQNSPKSEKSFEMFRLDTPTTLNPLFRMNDSPLNMSSTTITLTAQRNDSNVSDNETGTSFPLNSSDKKRGSGSASKGIGRSGQSRPSKFFQANAEAQKIPKIQLFTPSDNSPQENQLQEADGNQRALLMVKSQPRNTQKANSPFAKQDNNFNVDSPKAMNNSFANVSRIADGVNSGANSPNHSILAMNQGNSPQYLTISKSNTPEGGTDSQRQEDKADLSTTRPIEVSRINKNDSDQNVPGPDEQIKEQFVGSPRDDDVAQLEASSPRESGLLFLRSPQNNEWDIAWYKPELTQDKIPQKDLEIFFKRIRKASHNYYLESFAVTSYKKALLVGCPSLVIMLVGLILVIQDWPQFGTVWSNQLIVGVSLSITGVIMMILSTFCYCYTSEVKRNWKKYTQAVESAIKTQNEHFVSKGFHWKFDADGDTLLLINELNSLQHLG